MKSTVLILMDFNDMQCKCTLLRQQPLISNADLHCNTVQPSKLSLIYKTDVLSFLRSLFIFKTVRIKVFYLLFYRPKFRPFCCHSSKVGSCLQKYHLRYHLILTGFNLPYTQLTKWTKRFPSWESSL